MCEIHGFYRQLPIAWENAAKSIELGGPGKLQPIFSATYGYFFPIRFPSYDFLTTWEMHGFSHQLLMAWEYAAKSTL